MAVMGRGRGERKDIPRERGMCNAPHFLMITYIEG